MKKKGMDFFLPFGTQLSGRDEPACYCEFPLPDMDLVVETGDYIGLKVKFFLNRFLKPVEKANRKAGSAEGGLPSEREQNHRMLFRSETERTRS